MTSSVPGAGAPCADLREPPSHGNNRISNGCRAGLRGSQPHPCGGSAGRESAGRRAGSCSVCTPPRQRSTLMLASSPHALTQTRGGLVGTLRIVSITEAQHAPTAGQEGGLLASQSCTPKGKAVPLSSNVTPRPSIRSLPPSPDLPSEGGDKQSL